jgi:hypothetical protein
VLAPAAAGLLLRPCDACRASAAPLPLLALLLLALLLVEGPHHRLALPCSSSSTTPSCCSGGWLAPRCSSAPACSPPALSPAACSPATARSRPAARGPLLLTLVLTLLICKVEFVSTDEEEGEDKSEEVTKWSL